ncbi:unnamed protein product [Caenorhabditis angaria]|uniref:Uncharacterized protein n=1 Tax=Caenorhabditis angaria TaxID=860376 RepID=A0A9P1IKY3_9PELO|nr:unnamed protein product [Caenorhabditis angaria]
MWTRRFFDIESFFLSFLNMPVMFILQYLNFYYKESVYDFYMARLKGEVTRENYFASSDNMWELTFWPMISTLINAALCFAYIFLKNRIIPISICFGACVQFLYLNEYFRLTLEQYHIITESELEFQEYSQLPTEFLANSRIKIVFLVCAQVISFITICAYFFCSLISRKTPRKKQDFVKNEGKKHGKQKMR